MVRRAVASNPLVRLSTWETEQETWTRTRLVLDAYLAKLRAFGRTGSAADRPDWLPEAVGPAIRIGRLSVISGSWLSSDMCFSDDP